MIRVLSAATISAAALLAVPATAQSGSWQIGNDQYHIYNNDLDINTRAGRATMLVRVERAASRLCRERKIDRRECVVATVQAATRVKRGASLQLALNERGAAQYAAR